LSRSSGDDTGRRYRDDLAKIDAERGQEVRHVEIAPLEQECNELAAPGVFAGHGALLSAREPQPRQHCRFRSGDREPAVALENRNCL
jgi:hypothetical protein